MFYAIDNDKLMVESISENGEELASYILDNDLSLALTLVSEPDELVLSFTMEEMAVIYGHIAGNPPDFEDEDHAAALAFRQLDLNQEEFPVFTETLGRKLLKQGEKSDPQPSAKGVKKRAPSKRISLNYEDALSVVDGKCKSGSILDTIVKAIDEDMCETVGDVVEYITENHIIPKTGELADIKFAEHNIKYFLKQGKLEIEEEL